MQIRGVRVSVNQGSVPVWMGVPVRRRHTGLVDVIVMLVVRVGVIVLHVLVDVLVRVGLVQEHAKTRRHESHGRKVEAA